MKRLLKELIQLEKKRNSLLADINENLKTIASKDDSTKKLFEKTREDFQKNIGQSAF